MAEKTQDKKPKTTPKQGTDAMAPKITLRGERVLQHHLFESNVANLKKNVSYTPGVPDLKDSPHKHFFHTIDSRGKKLTQTDIVQNHFHAMEWGIDSESGELWAKSGQAMKMVTKNYQDGTSEVIPERVGFADKRGKVQYDDHNHEWAYVDTEEFTAKSMEARRQSTRAETGAVMVQPIQTAQPFNAADPATIVPTTSRIE